MSSESKILDAESPLFQNVVKNALTENKLLENSIKKRLSSSSVHQLSVTDEAKSTALLLLKDENFFNDLVRSVADALLNNSQ